MFKVNNSLGFLLGSSAKRVQQRFAQLMKENDIEFGHGGWIVLSRLWEEDGLNQQEISDRSGVAKPNISTYCDQLAKDDFIVRTPNDNDRRNYRIYLTNKGNGYKNICQKLAQQSNEELASELNEKERQHLLKLLRKIV